jgi:pantetheine-phosphate adenylyltransferase
MIAVYPGSFDPVTVGHYDIIKRAAAMYDKLIVLVAANSTKNAMFSAAERVEMLQATSAGLANVVIDRLTDGLLVDYAKSREAYVIVKGLRAVSDFEYEFQQALLNRRLQPEIETVFLMASSEHSFLSSSIVKEIGRLGGRINGLVPEALLPVLNERFSAG